MRVGRPAARPEPSGDIGRDKGGGGGIHDGRTLPDRLERRKNEVH
ncbi:hypothetical protein [Azospirillum largimobile]